MLSTKRFMQLSIFIILAWMVTHFVFLTLITNQKEQVHFFLGEFAQLKMDTADLQQKRQLYRRWEEQLKFITALQKNNFRAVEALKEISHALPEDISLIEIKKNQEVFTLIGIATNTNAITYFMQKLGQNELFQPPQLVMTAMQPAGKYFQLQVKQHE